MPDVLLLHPAEHSKTFGGMPPLGMSWIASYLESKGITAELADMQVDASDVATLLERHKPRMVGIGGTSHTRFESFRIAKLVKRHDERIIVVYGGPHATFTAHDTLTHIPEIDAVIRGEGEIPTQIVAARVLTGKPLAADIPGISFREGTRIVHTTLPSRIENLDILPFPQRSPDSYSRYNLTMEFLNEPGASVITSRGCPINCSFCSASAMFGTTLTFRGATNVVDEIERLVSDYGVRGIKFFDSTLTLKKSHVLSLCAELQRRKVRVKWECEIRVNTVDKDLLRTMRDAGCYYVDFGIESASASVLKRMHKNIRIEQAINLLRWTRDLGILTKVFFTFGHIGETLTDAFATVAFMEKHARFITMPATGVGIRIYPGTDVEGYAQSNGYLSQDFSWSLPYEQRAVQALGNDPQVPILIQPQFGWEEFRRVSRRLGKFWLKNPHLTARVLKSHLKLRRGFILLDTIWRASLMQLRQTSLPK